MMAHPAPVVVVSNGSNGAAAAAQQSSAAAAAAAGGVNSSAQPSSGDSSSSPPRAAAATAQQPQTVEELEKKHAAVCAELCMDQEAARASWESYMAVRRKHQLEGDQMHWFSCSLHIACRAGRLQTVGSTIGGTTAISSATAAAASTTTVEGNCVSLTHLLRACKLTFLEFIHKMERWMELVGSGPEFRERIERQKQKLIVSLLVYDKYQKIFKDVFVGLQADEAPSRLRKKTIATTPCSARKLYDFCWYLFLCVKSEHPTTANSADLVTTFNMLLCCIDLVFANVVADRRADLVNAKLLTDPAWNTGGLLKAAADADEAAPEAPAQRICTMEQLCHLYDGTYIDAMQTKRTAFGAVLRRLCADRVLRSAASSGDLLGLLSVEHFEPNLAALRTCYKTFYLSVGEIDEGILLQQVESTAMQSVMRHQTDESRKQMMPPTPLTRRYYLPVKEADRADRAGEPVAMAGRSVQRLRTALGAWEEGGALPASLVDLLGQAREDARGRMAEMLGRMRAQFAGRFEAESAKERFELAEMLYYRLLENIVRREQATRPGFDFRIMRHDVFHATLVACSVEIVIHAYAGQNMGPRRFPWVLECFGVEPYHFYKIIEMIVLNHGDILSRDVIKHLNAIEEKCIDSLVWRSSSPLWDQIAQCDQLPERLDADIPKPQSQLLFQQQQQQQQHGPRSAMERLLQSPIDVAERFHAETPNQQTNSHQQPHSDSVAKQLFKTSTSSSAPSMSTRASATASATASTASSASTSSAGSAAGSGSMKLFFRKFYKLAYLRMVEICRHLPTGNYLNDQYLQKIWTIFEYSITKETELMRDRHLDQILMCAIYVFGRNGKFQTTFKDIMMSYRKQPQTTSDVYRDVHMTEADIAFERTTTPNQQQQQHSNDSSASNKKYDIISFYNFCYVRSMQEFVMSTKEDGMLSPLPTYGQQLMSPRRVSENHSLYIQPFEPRELPLSPNMMTYSFKASPVERQNYSHIQRVLAQATLLNSNGKRELPFDAANGSATGAGAGMSAKMSRLVQANGTGGGIGGGVSAAQSAQSQTQATANERVPYIREKLQKIITDRQCNN